MTSENTDHRPRRASGLLALAAAVLASGLLAACGSSGGSSSSSTNTASSSGSGGAASSTAATSTGSTNLAGVTLQVGDQAGTGAQAVLTAAGLIDKLPFKVKWDDFTSGSPMMQAMASGSVDIGSVGNSPPIFTAAGGAKIALVGAQTNSANFNALLVPKGSSITSLAQLKGKKIAVPQGSSSDYNLLAALTKAGISVHDVTLDYLQPADALAAFGSHQVDAVDLWQPFVQQAISQDGAHILTNGGAYPGNYSYVVASKTAIANPTTAAAIKVYLKYLNQAYRWAGTHPAAWAKVWAKATGLSQTIMTGAAKNAVYTPVPITPSVTSSEQAVANAFFTAGLIPKKVDFQDYSSTAFNSSVGGG